MASINAIPKRGNVQSFEKNLREGVKQGLKEVKREVRKHPIKTAELAARFGSGEGEADPEAWKEAAGMVKEGVEDYNKRKMAEEFDERALREQRRQELLAIRNNKLESAQERMRAHRQLERMEAEDRQNSKFSKFKRGVATTGRRMAAAGRGAATAGRVAGDAAEKVGGAAMATGRTAQNIVVNTGEAAGKVAAFARSSELFFLFVVIVHIIDWWFLKFDRHTNIMFIAYTVVSIFAYFAILKDPNQPGLSWRPKAVGTVIFLSGVAFFISWLAGFLKGVFPSATWVEYFIVFFPIWPIFMLLANPQNSRRLAFLGALYIGAWIVFLIIILIVSMNGPANMGLTHGPVPMRDVAKDLWDKVVVSVKKLWRGILGLPADVMILYNRTKYEELYIGTVEENEGLPLGIYVKEFKPISSTRFLVNQSIYFEALLQGATFLKNPPILESHCYYKAYDKPPIYANNTVNVTPFRKEIKFMEPFYVRCLMGGSTFNKTGPYTVTYRGVYNFSTWAYSTWVFVDESIRTSYIRQGMDINTEFGIPKYLTTYFTNGPANVGMSNLELPISLVRGTSGRTNTYFSVSISAKEPNTEILRVNRFSVLVPKEIKLSDCDKQGTVTEEDGEYNEYTFDLGGEVGMYHRSISCWLNVTDANALLGDRTVTYKTFVVDAAYLVQVERSTTIQVDD
jgi:hypothetical protein